MSSTYKRIQSTTLKIKLPYNQMNLRKTSETDDSLHVIISVQWIWAKKKNDLIKTPATSNPITVRCPSDEINKPSFPPHFNTANGPAPWPGPGQIPSKIAVTPFDFRTKWVVHERRMCLQNYVICEHSENTCVTTSVQTWHFACSFFLYLVTCRLPCGGQSFAVANMASVTQTGLASIAAGISKIDPFPGNTSPSPPSCHWVTRTAGRDSHGRGL